MRTMRLRAGLSRAEVGARLSLTRQAVRSWEIDRPRLPGYATLVALLDLYGATGADRVRVLELAAAAELARLAASEAA